MIKSLWEKWKAIAGRIGDFQFKLVFSVLYYVLIVPVGLISNLFNDYLNLKGTPKWETLHGEFSNIEDLKEQ